MTSYEEERAEAAIMEFISKKDNMRIPSGLSMKEIAYGLIYMKNLLIESETKHYEEITKLNTEINDLKTKMAGMSLTNKENADNKGIKTIPTFKRKFKKTGEGKVNLRLIKANNEGPLIEDFPEQS